MGYSPNFYVNYETFTIPGCMSHRRGVSEACEDEVPLAEDRLQAIQSVWRAVVSDFDLGHRYPILHIYCDFIVYDIYTYK